MDALRPVAGDDWQALRRLCAGSRDAGATTAKLHVLDHTWNGIARIIKEVLGRRTDCFLVPSRIAEGLSAKLRSHLNINILDAPGIKALFEGCLDTISRLRPTESEREAFLLTDLSDSLLQRLPIHARSDGTVGDADGICREADWPIPAALTHVAKILPKWAHDSWETTPKNTTSGRSSPLEIRDTPCRINNLWVFLQTRTISCTICRRRRNHRASTKPRWSESIRSRRRPGSAC